MKKTAQYLLILSISLACTAFAEPDCGELPFVPDMPKGKKATVDEMIAAKNSVVAYQENAKIYRTCLSEKVEGLAAAVDGEAKEEAKIQTALLLKDFNASVEAEEKLAAAFNKSIRDFKKAKKKK